MNLNDVSKQLRKYIIMMNCYAGSGHPGGSLSSADIIAYLFEKELNFSVENQNNINRDRFVLSKGHACLALYAVLAYKGFFSVEEFKSLRKVGGMLQGHPDRLKTPGVEFNSGSLGQGFSFAIGCALGAKLKNLSYRTYALLGDGELNEGQVWEGAMFASHYRLDNLVAIVDYNKLQSDDFCSNITSIEPLRDKFVAFGWEAIEIDGHNFEQIENAFGLAKNTKNKPFIIIAHTIKGKGVSFMENNPKWHGSLSPSGIEKEIAFKELGIKDGEL
ncbi:MAG: transketolase [Desulfurella sp.]